MNQTSPMDWLYIMDVYNRFSIKAFLLREVVKLFK